MLQSTQRQRVRHGQVTERQQRHSVSIMQAALPRGKSRVHLVLSFTEQYILISSTGSQSFTKSPSFLNIASL